MVIRSVLSVPNESPGRSFVKCYSRLGIEKMRRAVASISWLPDRESPTVEDKWAFIRRDLIRLTGVCSS